MDIDPHPGPEATATGRSADPATRSDRLIQVQLAIAAVAFAVIGLNGLLNPTTVAAGIGLQIMATAGFDEVRANYGGLQLAIAAILVIGLVRAPARRPALAVVTAVCAGLAFGRLVSIAVDGLPPANMVGLLVIEATTVASGANLWYRSTRK
ncbi:DUF4345 domain-containing protein [Nocardia sp. NPDC005825]|uniref:DUF4345 domain-containing protein n=1 Tax=unclassified Nocardia TaxID=2637762 RepID=UPI0033DC39A9